MGMLVSRRGPTRLLTQGGGFGHGHGDGFGRGFLQRTDEELRKRQPGCKPPGRGCGSNALAVVAIAIATPLLSGLT